MLSATACQFHLRVSAQLIVRKSVRTLPFLFAGLVSDGAAGLACGLAGRLALAASALLHAFLKGSGIQSLNMLHCIGLL